MRLFLLCGPLFLLACDPAALKVDSEPGNSSDSVPSDDSSPPDDSQVEEAPHIAVDPSTLDLGPGVPNQPLSGVVTVQNTGTGTLTGTTESNSGYTVDQASFSIPAGASVVLTVSFSAADPGSYPGTLELSSNDADAPLVTVALTATIEADADGDGTPDSTDCAPDDATIYPDATEIWYNGIDENCDGNDDDQDEDGYSVSEDCEDTNAGINPGATEFWYNGTDENCDGNDDDQDLDGYSKLSDCDDVDAGVNPGATEIWYDGVDQNCDGNDDDQDNDGYGITSDCDDLNLSINPAGTEVWYNGIDENCDGQDDDQDNDGYLRADDCDDTDANVSPGATESWYNGIDENCDGRDDDVDQDGFGIATDCDDLDATVNPSATETWYDGIDQDCDGNDDDQDGDGYGASSGDCNDYYSNINPGVSEICDGVDQDCDGTADNNAVDATAYYTDADGDTYGSDSSAVYACTQPANTVARGGDCDDSNANLRPSGTEICDGLDNDCSGIADDQAIDATTYYLDADSDTWGGSSTLVSCTQPAGYLTTTGDCDDNNAGAYPGATEIWYDGVDQNCDGNDDDRDGDGSAYPTDCDDTDSSINPSATEVCDSVDNNCDGDTDGDAVDRSTWYTDADSDSYGDDNSSSLSCTAPSGTAGVGGDCDDGDASVNPAATEINGDGTDQNCDGQDGPTSASTATWTVVGSSASHAVGVDAAIATSDLNADGDPEWILATATDDTRATNAGAVAFHDNGTKGSNDSFSTGGFVLFGGASSGDGLGKAVIPLGDVDSDGRGEVLATATGVDNNTRTDSGTAYIFDLATSGGTAYSGTNSVDTAREGRLYSENSYAYFGTAAGIGDFDGDGATDLMVGAPGWYFVGGYQNLGAVYIFDGSDTWWNNSSRVTNGDYDGMILGNAAGVSVRFGQFSATSWDDDFFGAALVAGDFNGDGDDDAVMCSPYAATNAGTCWMVDGGDMLGSSYDTVTSLDVASFTGAAANDELGGYNQSLAAADIDGDSIDDLILGARSYGTTNGGAVLVQYGGSWSGAYTPSSVDVLLTGVGGLGAAVSAPGDLDGDGFGELLLGSPDTGAGRAYLLNGAGLSSGAIESSGAASWNGEVTGDLFGLSLGGVADLDRDGTTDIVVAAPGYDYNGNSSSGKAYVLTTP